MTSAHACGKVILFGEHAVVYGRPAIAVPVTEVQARATVEPGSSGQGLVVHAPDLVRTTMKAMLCDGAPDLTITVASSVPIARGMGSGAAVSAAIVRALARHCAHWFASQAVSDLVYETEVIYHGTPSGIDNTVIAFEKPVYFVKDLVQEIFWVGEPLLLAIGDTGIESSTREVVGDLRFRYEADPNGHDVLFDRIGEITARARQAMELGEIQALGRLMDENHALLQELGVSCPELDCLVTAAREGGALGAKLSGSGRGGNMIALISEETQGRVDMMLRLAGASNVIVTEVR
jgi:mevalonate kinase